MYNAPILNAVASDTSTKPPVLKANGNLIVRGIG